MLKQLELALVDAPATTAWPISDFLTFRAGRVQYKVRNTRERLAAAADAVRKCPGWTGKRTPKPARRVGGVVYTHRTRGFKLLIPFSLQKSDVDHPLLGPRESWLQIGNVTLTLHHRTRSISGEVPAAWLVDLNAPSPDEGTS